MKMNETYLWTYYSSHFWKDLLARSPTNQPTNPPAHQPTNQPTNQPIKQATNQPINHFIRWFRFRGFQAFHVGKCRLYRPQKEGYIERRRDRFTRMWKKEVRAVSPNEQGTKKQWLFGILQGASYFFK